MMSQPPRTDQTGEEGFAALMLVVLLGAGMLVFMAAMMETGGGADTRRFAETGDDLLRAREAVVAYRLSNSGAFPCPDTSPFDGASDATCTGVATGSCYDDSSRLPWGRTIGLIERESGDVYGTPISYVLHPAGCDPAAGECTSYTLTSAGPDRQFCGTGVEEDNRR